MMNSVSHDFKSDNLSGHTFNNAAEQGKFSFDRNGRTPVFENLAYEGCEHFFPYLDFLGLAKASDVLLLSSTRHFYYTAEEVTNFEAIINLKPLNNVKDIRSLLHNIFHLIPQKSCFIGCFINNKKQKLFSDQPSGSFTDSYETSIESRIPFINKMYSLFDLRTNRFLSLRTATILLEESGFKVNDMTEINGLTYFYARKIQNSKE